MDNKAIKTTTSVMGIIAGVVGMEHGIGAILQGNTQPQGIVFPSWVDSPFFDIMAGEPAMSLIPNFLISGIITVLLSILVILWACTHLQRKNGGWILILLSIILLLVGGGFGPPLLGIIIGTTATRSANLGQMKPGANSNRLIVIIQSAWRFIFTANLLLWLFLFPGIPLLRYFLRIESEMLVPIATLFAFALLGLSIFSAFVHDGGITTVPAQTKPEFN